MYLLKCWIAIIGGKIMDKKKKIFVNISVLLIVTAIIFNADIPNKVYVKKFLNIDIEKAKSIKNNIPGDILDKMKSF